MTALKKQFKEVKFEGKKGDLIEVHATTVRGKGLAVLIINDKIEKVINKRNDQSESLKEEQEKEIIRKISMKEMFQEKRENLNYFYKEYRKEELKKSQAPLYFIKTFLRVPAGCNWSLYKWDVLAVNEKKEIENITYLFKDLTSHREGYELHYGSALPETLRHDGFTIGREL